MAQKSGLISDMLGDAWRYVGTSCSCQGRKQHEIYIKGQTRLKYYFKINEYQINNEQTKPIQEIEADIKA